MAFGAASRSRFWDASRFRHRAGLPARLSGHKEGRCSPSLAAKKPRSRRGCVAKRTKREKSTPIFPIILSQPDRFCQAFGPQREFRNCALLSREACVRGADVCRNSPFLDLSFKKNFSYTPFGNSRPQKEAAAPGKARPSKKPIFLRPAHDKLHFARRLLFPFGRLPSAEKTDVCREVCQKRSFAGEICRLPGLPGAPLGGAAKEGI